MSPETSTPLHAAKLYWNAAAATYEQDFSGTTVGKIRREIVWSNLERIFQPSQHILELSWTLRIPVPEFALTVREMKIVQSYPLGSHTFFIARVVDRTLYSNAPEFHRMHGLYARLRKA